MSTEVLPKPDAVLEVTVSERAPRVLTTGVPRLDRALGPFASGQVTLIDSGSDFVFALQSLLAVRNVLEHGSEVVFVDGGNAVDPHGMVAVAKRFGRARGDVLPFVNVARAFTCYQMASLVLDVVPRKVEEVDAGLLILSGFPELYLDEDVPAVEAHQLFLQSMRAVRALADQRQDLVVLATNAGLSKLQRRRGIRRVLYDGADVRLRFQQQGETVAITHLDDYRRETYAPVAPGQTTLEDFEGGARRAFPLEVRPREVKETERLFLGW